MPGFTFVSSWQRGLPTLAILALLVALTAAACGGSDDGDSGSQTVLRGVEVEMHFDPG